MTDLATAPFLTVSSAGPAAEALAAMTAAGIALCLVTEEDAPVTLLSAEDLVRLSAAAPGPLRDLRDRLPAIVLVQDVSGISAATVQAYALLLEESGAPGLVVPGEEGTAAAVAAVAAVAVAEALGRVAPAMLRAVPNTLAPAFVCRRHRPPVYLYPRTGDQVPRCPRDPLHGRMDRVDLDV